MSTIIDMNNLSNQKIDEVTTSFQVRWDNVLLLTAYSANETFILTVEGEKIVLTRRLQDVLAKFAAENGIPRYLMETLYKQVGCRTRGYVAGHHRLVPSCGVSNERVVYYMVHHLDHAEPLAADKGTLMVFKGDHQRFYVAIPSPEKTFRRIIRAADEVAGIQLAIYESCREQYGKLPQGQLAERSYDSDYYVIQERREKSRYIMEETVIQIIKTAFIELYGEVFDKELLAQVKRVINRY